MTRRSDTGTTSPDMQATDIHTPVPQKAAQTRVQQEAIFFGITPRNLPRSQYR